MPAQFLSNLLFLGLALVLLLASCSPAGPPYDPQAALETFEIEPGFKIELFAAEPEITDPVAMDIDEFGHIYVLENHGYPLDTESRRGKVKLLEDNDNDGRPDRTTIYADGLNMPTGVMRWKQGVIVTDPPDVLYFEDSDGDGRSDLRRVMLTGFPFANPQHTVSSPMYGLDNWIYLSHEGASNPRIFTDQFGDPGSDIHYPEQPESPRLEVARRSLRFRPDTLQLEWLAGPSQFGQTFDRWGRLFTHNNSNHVRHEVIAARYLERNPDLRLSRPWHDMPDHGNAGVVFPITIQPRFEILTRAGQITSASGLTLYLGGAFGPDFENVSFVAEPAHNLVHSDVWSPQGATFVAKRAHPEREFLASTDSWFRPVNFYIGPNGALYLMDYYREVIEHPEWTAEEIHESEILYHGSDKGRIYRITPESGLPLPNEIRLGEAADLELVEYLDHPNIWWRRTAQRLLVDQQNVEIAGRLTRIVTESPSAVARVHALWTLEGLDKLEASLVEVALEDPEPGVRENAVILAERYLGDSPKLAGKLVAMRNDPDARVRMQLVCTLGYAGSPAAREVRDELLFRDIEDTWMQVAALSWPSVDASALLSKAVSPGGIAAEKTRGRETFFERLGSLAGASGESGQTDRMLSAVVRDSGAESAWWKTAALRGLAQGFEGREKAPTPQQQRALVTLAESGDNEVRGAALSVLEAAEAKESRALNAAARRAADVAQDPAADAARRADAVRLLALAGDADLSLLQELLEPGKPQAVQREAAKALSHTEASEAAELLLARWRSLDSSVRAAALDGLTESDERVTMLLDAIEDGAVQTWTLASVRNRLIMQENPELRERARRLLTTPERERQQVVERYEAALELEGDAGNGALVFERVCSKCHRFNGEGKQVGPDIETVRSRPASVLLSDILIPNQSIEPDYEAYVVETADGRTIDGVLGPETPNAITLRREEGEEDVIPRDNIKQMYAAELSAMPPDLEEQVSVQEMADLLRYIKAPHSRESVEVDELVRPE